MRRLVTSRLIRIYTVCHSVIDFFLLKPLFATMDESNFKDGRVHFRNSGEIVFLSQTGFRSRMGQVRHMYALVDSDYHDQIARVYPMMSG